MRVRIIQIREDDFFSVIETFTIGIIGRFEKRQDHGDGWFSGWFYPDQPIIDHRGTSRSKLYFLAVRVKKLPNEEIQNES